MEILETFRTKPPRGGLWKLKHKISGTTFISHQLGALKDRIWKHEESNGYPTTPEAEIENQLCQQFPHSCGSDTPTVLERASNFVGSMVEWAKQGFPLASEQVLQNRLDVCQQCEYWRGVAGGTLISGKCRKCGCRGLKLAMETERCPIGKW